VEVIDDTGETSSFDHIVIATHSDQALAMLADPSDAERTILGALRYGGNDAIMHGDAALMPRRRRAWCSWNYLDPGDQSGMCVTYWMNRLQTLPTQAPIFVTLNPHREPEGATVIHREHYEHPLVLRRLFRRRLP
jgi:predicted NAD/FAD-binding protein